MLTMPGTSSSGLAGLSASSTIPLAPSPATEPLACTDARYAAMTCATITLSQSADSAACVATS